MSAFLQFFHCLTPLHNGAGQGLGSLDRPIIREVTTGYPYVQSSTIKGALKALVPESEPWRTAAFGKGETDGNQGCLLFGDVNLLLFPVRSLAGTFAWIASPLSLARFARFAGLAEAGASLGALASDVVSNADFARSSALGASKTQGAAGTDWDQVLRVEEKYYLEGLCLTPRDDQKGRASLAALSDALGKVLFSDGDYWHKVCRGRVLVLHDDDFRHLVHHATVVEANIAIDQKTGVTTDGSLRYSEYLPPETVLYALLQIDKPLGGIAGGQDVDVAANFRAFIANRPAQVVQLGADESKGKGLVRTRLLGSALATGQEGIHS